MLPFTVEQFFDVFGRYNTSVWPMQLVLLMLAALAIASILWKSRLSDRSVATLLGAFWVWMGAAYHLAFFTAINPAAIGFGAAFVMQGFLFLYAGLIRQQLTFAVERNWHTLAEASLLTYALLLYPLLGAAAGHEFPRAPTFGLPCPTVIFTFGVLLLALKPPPIYLLVIPNLWAVIGTSAAILLGVWQDLGLFPAAAIAWIGIHADRRVA